MSTRGVRVWRRTDVTLPPSFLIEHARNEGCLMIENGACLEISECQEYSIKRNAFNHFQKEHNLKTGS